MSLLIYFTEKSFHLSFSRKIRHFWNTFQHHQLPNMMIAKFTPSDFIKKMIGKHRFFTQTEHPLYSVALPNLIVIGLQIAEL